MIKTAAELDAMPERERKAWVMLELITVLNAAERATLKDTLRHTA